MAVCAIARPSYLRRRVTSGLLALLALTAVAGECFFVATPAQAQLLVFPPRPPRPKPTPDLVRRQSDKAPMLVQATEIQYDYANKRVSAVGSVQMYFGGSTLEANKVTYDEAAKRLHAEGNVRLTEADGRVTLGEIMNLSDDFRDGFVDSLRLDSPDATRMAASRADRS